MTELADKAEFLAFAFKLGFVKDSFPMCLLKFDSRRAE
jgi:hypothetical protein